ncbi:galactose mutarotase [Devosia yakushimensis]|uniref:Galactose mutarotase n=1 Tax=Devosia yakushimensis TaxID=470028 RepID=A0ABQ5UJ52_9HYPH|nr:aldose 1-epimerase [Devosia yakushimensis]GLQ12068.1 galactose mutarotase [Devosia yakushimensis]
MSIGERILLKCGAIALEVAPAFGGRVTRLTHDSVDVLVPLEAQEFHPPFWPRAGAYPMVPYHNRIEGGRLRLDGCEVALPSHPDAQPHTLHGPAHLAAWQVSERNDTTVTLALERAADPHWPWKFSARQTFVITEGGLRLKLSVTNRGETAMPVGLGWHPYIAGCQRVRHDAEYEWPIRKDYLPTGDRQPVIQAFDENVSGTHYLSCWSDVQVDTKDDLTLTISASPTMSHLVLHKGDGDFVCIEPVSHLANGFNLHARQILGTGARILAPVEEMSATIELNIEKRRS